MEINEFIKSEAEKVSKKYKKSQTDIEEVISDYLSKEPSLSKAVQESLSKKDIERLSVYKNFIKKVKKDIYYSLRRYYQEERNSEEHISVKERAPYIDSFNKQLLDNFSGVKTIIDIGGGLFPLTFPFEKFPKLESYIWVDKDAKAFEILKKQNNPKLFLYNDSIGDRSWDYYLPPNVPSFDLALMVKLISVVGRQEKDLIPLLANVPAELYLVTAPAEALTRKEDIRRRENKTLQNFISLTGRTVESSIEIPNEFGYVLK